MIGERLAEIRKDHGDNQDDLARKLNVSVFAIRSWEQEKSAPSHEMLVRVCRLYQVSSDYLLGLSNIDPVYEQRRRLEQFSPEELTDLKNMSPTFYGKNAAKKIKRKPPAHGPGVFLSFGYFPGGIIPAPSYGRRSGHRHCPPARQ